MYISVRRASHPGDAREPQPGPTRDRIKAETASEGRAWSDGRLVGWAGTDRTLLLRSASTAQAGGRGPKGAGSTIRGSGFKPGAAASPEARTDRLGRRKSIWPVEAPPGLQNGRRFIFCISLRSTSPDEGLARPLGNHFRRQSPEISLRLFSISPTRPNRA